MSYMPPNGVDPSGVVGHPGDAPAPTPPPPPQSSRPPGGPGPPPPRKPSRHDDEEQGKLFVGGLSWDTTQGCLDSLVDIFLPVLMKLNSSSICFMMRLPFILHLGTL